LPSEAGVVKEGFGFFLSRRVLGRAIKACIIKEGSGSCHKGWCRRSGFWVVLSTWVGILEASQRRITSLWVWILAGRAVMGVRDGSVGASLVGQVWISSMPSKIGSWFLAGRQGLSSLRALQVDLVSQSVGWIIVRCRRWVRLTTGGVAIRSCVELASGWSFCSRSSAIVPDEPSRELLEVQSMPRRQAIKL
jgi:hypothetical protein